ncbi:MAG: MurR/RpiR family transcriptional regulator [Hyphomicrobiaceae bacterium]
MANDDRTIADRLQMELETLTRAERQLAHAILRNYPVSGLGSITSVAETAGVSTPTVARMVQKLGFSGFPDFQASLRQELEARISDPIVKRDLWVETAPHKHILNRFTEAVVSNIEQTLTRIDPHKFDMAVELLADTERRLYIVGGRITRALADYLFLHMQVVRNRVTQVQAISNAWPHYLLDIERGDVLVVFDVRRYENGTLRLAEMAHEKGVIIILLTDQWRSPVHKLAKLTFGSRIPVPSAWDSSIAIMLLIETLIAAVQERTWPDAKSRMEELEIMFDRTRFFRKFT